MTSDPKLTNHLGKPHRHFDEAGVVTLETYDFKGNALEKTREVINPQKMIDAVEAANSANGYVVDTFRVDWTQATGQTLGDRKAELVDNGTYRTSYKTKSVFDALNRPVEMTLPADEDSADGADYGKTIIPRFNRAGALQSVAMSGADTPSVDYIAYNARGQRILAALGNGVMTRYAYDENVFRLSRMRSEKYASSSIPQTGFTLPTDGSGKKYQDIVYAYDAVGNILSTDERVADIGLAGADEMVRNFTYDALYRLVSATGRESDVQKSEPWQDQLSAKSALGYNDSPTNTRQYTELYTYDEVGGLTQLVHQYGSPSAQWARNYTTEAGSNRMTGLSVGANAYTYAYDSVGNLIQENTERHFEWDFGGRMRAFRNQVSGSPASVFAHYSYDGGGQRVQKIVTRGAKTTRTVYIGGVFEHQQVIENYAVTVENQTLHLMDGAKRVATHRAGGELDGGQRPATRYHLGDHLQSSNVVLRQTEDVNGELFLNREEYRPYGETAFGSFEYKRYRFTGKEKDEESGLHYHSARYYAPWAARWTAPDPVGMVDGPNLYGYVSGNPLKYLDPNGTSQLGAIAVDGNVGGSEPADGNLSMQGSKESDQTSSNSSDNSKPEQQEIGVCYESEAMANFLGETQPNAIERNRQNVRHGRAASISAQRGPVLTYKQYQQQLQRQLETLSLLGASPGANIAMMMAYSKGARGEALDRAARLGYSIEGVATAGVVSVGRAKASARLQSYTGKEIPFNRGFAPIKLHKGGQGKHVRGEHNFDPKKSELTHPDPAKLIEDFAGSGAPLTKMQRGKPGYKERIDFGTVIGTFRNKKGTIEEPTTRGIIHYSKHGLKIVPSRPKGQ